MFWDTCAEGEGLFYKHTHAMVVCCTHPPSSTLGISPNVIPLQSPQPCYPSPSFPIPQQVLMYDVPLPMSMCSHCSTPTYG